MTYRKYDPMIKKMIIQTGNKNLFPELNIPRTTINYWLKHSKEPVTSSGNNLYENSIQTLKTENYELKAKNLLVKQCLERLIRELGGFDKRSKENRKFIVELVEDFKEFLSLREVIEVVGISSSTYYRWRVEAFGCDYNTMSRCSPTKPTQLTHEEQNIIVDYATRREFKKFSTISLMHYCRKRNILHASLESWYKYMKLYGVKRITFKRKRKRFARGIRAKSKNEIWHIDITELKYGGQQKSYLQLVVDNYSRFIVGWKLSTNKKMNVTCSTILKSFHMAPEFKGVLMSDGGAENTGRQPKQLLIGLGIKQLIAKVDTRFSNSMVEAVFRQLKQKFYLKEAKNYKALYQTIYRFVHQYNSIIPHSSLKGATPMEKFKGSFNLESYQEEIKSKLFERRNERREYFKECMSCTKKFLRHEKVWI